MSETIFFLSIPKQSSFIIRDQYRHLAVMAPHRKSEISLAVSGGYRYIQQKSYFLTNSGVWRKTGQSRRPSSPAVARANFRRSGRFSCPDEVTEIRSEGSCRGQVRIERSYSNCLEVIFPQIEGGSSSRVVLGAAKWRENKRKS